MCLHPESVGMIFRTIQQYAGARNWVVFDYIYASILGNEGNCYGETGILRTVSGCGGVRFHRIPDRSQG